MKVARVIVSLLFVGLLGVPLLFRQGTSLVGASRQLIIITPHNEQIRSEFGRAFADWHSRQRGSEGEVVQVVWSVPGGSSDIRRMLEAQFGGNLQAGMPVGGAADLVFGGGQYEHDKLKEGIQVVVAGEQRASSISAPVEFGETYLTDIYGDNDVAGNLLYDPDGYWFGTALSAFGIIYNHDSLARLGLPTPIYWSDLAQARLRGWIAVGNPAQSGSMRKSFDIVLQRRGWVEGWGVLRRIAANSRYFSASSSMVPISVSQGDAAAGVCIDFYGRFQAQAVLDAGDPDRLGYIDPPGESALDADPISLLRGAPDPELAISFIRFCLSEEAQALWQFRRDDQQDELGPERFELRRMPIRRTMYDRHFDRFVDQVNPFEFGQPLENSNPDYWSFVALLFSAMAVDEHDRLERAWGAITEHPAYPGAVEQAALRGAAIATSKDADDVVLREMLEHFDAMPTVPGPESDLDLSHDRNLSTIKDGWLRRGWADFGLWPAEAAPASTLRSLCSRFFAGEYDAVLQVASGRPLEQVTR